MLTPIFKLTQDEQFLYLTIEATMAKISETEIVCESKEVFFTSPPYFLRVYLPAQIIEDNPSAKYDSDMGTFSMRLQKFSIGEHFEGLDLLTKLMTHPKKEKPMIETINSKETPENEKPVNPGLESDSENSEIDYNIEQTLPATSIASKYSYGFASTKSGIIERLRDEIDGLFQFDCPEVVSYSERMDLCIECDIEQFSEEHYLGDLLDPTPELQSVFEFKIDWAELSKLTNEDRQRLIDLPKRDAFDWLSKSQKREALLSLVDILYSYMYEYRTNLGEMTCESSWTVQTLSPTLSCLCAPQSMETCISGAVRKSLIYPLYRNWQLANLVKKDVSRALKLGNVCILKILLQIHGIFQNGGQFRYVLNELYISDYCIWIQSISSKTLSKCSAELENITLTKCSMCLDLENIELSAELAVLDVNDTDSDDNVINDNVINDNDAMMKYVANFI